MREASHGTSSKSIAASAGRRLHASTTTPRPPHHRLFGLQGAAGNAAVTRLVDAHRLAVQRDVGFEFETDTIRVREVPGQATVPQAVALRGARTLNQWWQARQAATQPLAKATKILDDPAGEFSLEADEKGSESSGEIVSTHFPETGPGRQRLVQALARMVTIENNLKAMAGTNRVARSDDLAFGGAGNVVRHNVVVETPESYAGGWIGAPQMTMGLGLKDVPRFVSDLLKVPNESPAKLNDRRPGRALVRATPDNPTGGAQRGLVTGVSMADQAIAAYHLAHAGSPASPELRGLLTLIFSITESARLITPGFIKGLSDLLAKTDYATLFKSLPGPDRTYYGGTSKVFAKTQPRFVDLVAAAPGYAAMLGQPLLNVAAPMFDETFKGHGEWYKTLTLEQWLYAMTSGDNSVLDKMHGRGKDLLTTKRFPGRPAGETVMGFGTLGARTDTGPLGESLPVFEFRSFSRRMDLATFSQAALKLFDYVRGLNSGFHQRII